MRQQPMTEYRRKRGSGMWHWCRNCSGWPTDDFEVSYTEPRSGGLDNECQVKETARTCEKTPDSR